MHVCVHLSVFETPEQIPLNFHIGFCTEICQVSLILVCIIPIKTHILHEAQIIDFLENDSPYKNLIPNIKYRPH
jgi:hypothetical protein